MAELKTKSTGASVDEFLGKVDPARQDDCRTLVIMMAHATGAPPRMWGPAIIGFGDMRYRYESGREMDWFHLGFSPRKKDLTLYLSELDPALLKKLGKHKRGKGCLYINKLSDVDLNILDDMIAASLLRLHEIEKERKLAIAEKAPKKKGTTRRRSL